MRRMTRPLWALMVVAAMAGAACGGDGTTPGATGPAATEAPEAPLRVAMIMPGRQNDNSFNQSGAVGLKEAADADGNVEFTVLDQTPDPTDSTPAIRQFAAQGYDLIIGHGIEYVEPIHEVAAEFPDVAFMTAAGVALGQQPTDNINDWLYDFPSMGYLLGIAGGMATQANKVGIVGGPELDFVKTMHAGFKEGLASVNPDAEVVELFAGSFDDAQAAAEAASTEIQQGVDFVYCSGDGICQGVAQETDKASIPLVTGFGDLSGTAAGTALTATVLNLNPLYTDFFGLVRTGGWGNQTFVSDLANGHEEILPLRDISIPSGTSVADIQARVDEELAKIQNGEITPGG